MGGWIGRPQDRWRVPQHNPLILWLGRQIEEDVAPRQECLPGVFNGLPYLDQRLVEFVLDLLDDGLQQALLAIELVIESAAGEARSEEHTSELQSLMRISYAVFCLTKKK